MSKVEEISCVSREIRYVCNLCGKWSHEPSELSQCAKFGAPPSGELFPVGMITSDSTRPGIYIVQVLADALIPDGHTLEGNWWTFLDRVHSRHSISAGKCVGPRIHSGWLGNPERMEASGSLCPIPRAWEVDQSSPAYHRVYAYLAKLGIPPTIWSVEEGRVVPAPAPVTR